METNKLQMTIVKIASTATQEALEAPSKTEFIFEDDEFVPTDSNEKIKTEINAVLPTKELMQEARVLNSGSNFEWMCL